MITKPRKIVKEVSEKDIDQIYLETRRVLLWTVTINRYNPFLLSQIFIKYPSLQEFMNLNQKKSSESKVIDGDKLIHKEKS